MTRVLVVEDDPTYLENITTFLEMGGYAVVKASNGDQALERLRTGSQMPDIIISDIGMPLMDGYNLLKTVQSHEHWADIPFIFLTGRDSQEEIRQGKRLGVDDYLVKPFQVDDLMIAIENKLRRMEQWKQSTQRKIELIQQELRPLANGAQATTFDGQSLEANVAYILEDLEAMPNEFSQKALQALQSQVYQVNHLLSQIDLLLKIDQGQINQYVSTNAATCNLQACIEDAITFCLQDFGLSKSAIRLQPPSEPVFIHSVPELITTIFDEVLRNAVIFAISDAPVVITIRHDAQFVLAQVIDQGCGIEPDHEPLVWERFTQFYRTDLPQQGAGLGLAIVHECLPYCNGAAAIASQPGKGTTVSLRFPRVAAR